jgi:hypothetical protein
MLKHCAIVLWKPSLPLSGRDGCKERPRSLRVEMMVNRLAIMSQVPRDHVDDEYAYAGEVDPKVVDVLHHTLAWSVSIGMFLRLRKNMCTKLFVHRSC